MRKRTSIALVAVVAAIAVPAVVVAATSAYTSPTLKVRYAGAATVISATAASADDATARAAIYVPTGTAITATQAPGTQLGTVNAQVSALALGGALLPLTGPIIVAPPRLGTGSFPDRVHPDRDADSPRGCSSLRRRADDQPARLPDPDRGLRRQRWVVAKLVFCLAPPDVPTGHGPGDVRREVRQRRADAERCLRSRACSGVGSPSGRRGRLLTARSTCRARSHLRQPSRPAPSPSPDERTPPAARS